MTLLKKIEIEINHI